MSDAELVEQLFHSLAEFLSTAWTRKRLPYHFLEDFHAASSAPSDNTSRIFLESNFKAWVAYFVIRPGTANTQGQTARRQQFNALDLLPAREKRRLALKVNEVSPHPTVASLSFSMEHEARRDGSATASLTASKRRRTEHDGFNLSSSPAYPSPSYSQPFNDSSLAAADLVRSIDPTASNPVPAWTPRQREPMLTLSSTANSPSRPLQPFTHIPPGPHNPSPVSEPEILARADVAELDLFPEFLAGAIKRQDTSPKTAAVTFEFPRDSIADINCAMSIVIILNIVKRLTSLLFNAFFVTNENV